MLKNINTTVVNPYYTDGGINKVIQDGWVAIVAHFELSSFTRCFKKN